MVAANEEATEPRNSSDYDIITIITVAIMTNLYPELSFLLRLHNSIA
jgi:hypothetical protein